jgi:hypothetical protein
VAQSTTPRSTPRDTTVDNAENRLDWAKKQDAATEHSDSQATMHLTDAQREEMKAKHWDTEVEHAVARDRHRVHEDSLQLARDQKAKDQRHVAEDEKLLARDERDLHSAEQRNLHEEKLVGEDSAAVANARRRVESGEVHDSALDARVRTDQKQLKADERTKVPAKP